MQRTVGRREEPMSDVSNNPRGEHGSSKGCVVLPYLHLGLDVIGWCLPRGHQAALPRQGRHYAQNTIAHKFQGLTVQRRLRAGGLLQGDGSDGKVQAQSAAEDRLIQVMREQPMLQAIEEYRNNRYRAVDGRGEEEAFEGGDAAGVELAGPLRREGTGHSLACRCDALPHLR